jgi:hypothetical protein
MSSFASRLVTFDQVEHLLRVDEKRLNERELRKSARRALLTLNGGNLITVEKAYLKLGGQRSFQTVITQVDQNNQQLPLSDVKILYKALLSLGPEVNIQFIGKPEAKPFDENALSHAVKTAIELMDKIGRTNEYDIILENVFGGDQDNKEIVNTAKDVFKHGAVVLLKLFQNKHIIPDGRNSFGPLRQGGGSTGGTIELPRDFLTANKLEHQVVVLVHESTHEIDSPFLKTDDFGGYQGNPVFFATRPCQIKLKNAGHYDEVIRRIFKTNNPKLEMVFRPGELNNTGVILTPEMEAVNTIKGAWITAINLNTMLLGHHQHKDKRLQPHQLRYISMLLGLTIHKKVPATITKPFVINFDFLASKETPNHEVTELDLAAAENRVTSLGCMMHCKPLEVGKNRDEQIRNIIKHYGKLRRVGTERQDGSDITKNLDMIKALAYLYEKKISNYGLPLPKTFTKYWDFAKGDLQRFYNTYYAKKKDPWWVD